MLTNSIKYSLNFLLFAFLAIGIFYLVVNGTKLVSGADTTELSQTINAGSLDVTIVDGSGNTVASPSVSLGTISFNFDNNTTTGTLGSASEKMRVSNPTATTDWSLTFAATGGATAVWDAGASTDFDFNDPDWSSDAAGDTDAFAGVLYVQPSGGTIAGVSGCATTNVSLGSDTAFDEGTTDSVTLMSASSAATFCRWDLTGVTLDQLIPGSQPAGTYTLDMTLTAA